MVIPKILTFHSLVDNRDFYLSYKDVRSFDLAGLSTELSKGLGQVSGVEIVFPTSEFDLLSVSKLMLEIQNSFEHYTSDLFIRGLLLPVSKIRSYKGIIKEFKNPNIAYIEKEYVLKDESFFGCVVQLKCMDCDLFSKFFFNSNLNFTLMTKRIDELSPEILDEIMYSNYYESFGLNYLRLVLDKCVGENSIILRAGGDGGRTYFSGQYFVPKERLTQFLSVLTQHFHLHE